LIRSKGHQLRNSGVGAQFIAPNPARRHAGRDQSRPYDEATVKEIDFQFPSTFFILSMTAGG
jgi:hypothetical protein